MTKAELLAAIRRDRSALDEVVARVPEDGLTAPTLDARWSVKDVLAHISAWERLCLRWIREDARREGPFTQESLNTLNGRLHAEHRDDALGAVLERSRASSARILAKTEELSAEALAAAPAWAPGRPLAEVISSNSDEHYREHIEQIERWLARVET